MDNFCQLCLGFCLQLPTPLGIIPTLYHHQESESALIASVKMGCHLCQLIAAACWVESASPQLWKNRPFALRVELQDREEADDPERPGVTSIGILQVGPTTISPSG